MHFGASWISCQSKTRKVKWCCSSCLSKTSLSPTGRAAATTAKRTVRLGCKTKETSQKIRSINLKSRCHTNGCILGAACAGMVEDAHRCNNNGGQSHYAKSRERGRSLLQHVTNLFNKRGKQTLTDVSATQHSPFNLDLITWEKLLGDVQQLPV